MQPAVPRAARAALLLALCSCAQTTPPYPPDAIALPLYPRTTPSGGPRYLVAVDVGQPVQTLRLLLDTGSHLLLIRDAGLGACTTSDAPADGSCFNSSASSTISALSPGLSSNRRPLQYYVDVDIEVIGPYTPAEDYVSFAGLSPSSSSSSAQSQVHIALLKGSDNENPAERVGPARSLPYFWGDADGVLGASHSTVNANPIEYLLQPHGKVFALDFNPTASSSLLLGGSYAPPTDEDTAESVPVVGVEWSEVQQRPGYQQLTLFEPTVCGASLLGETSTHWAAIVDTVPRRGEASAMNPPRIAPI